MSWEINWVFKIRDNCTTVPLQIMNGDIVAESDKADVDVISNLREN
jgi:hypothetical protein